MRRTAPAAAALGLGLSLALSGCFANPLEGIVEGGIEQIIEDQTGVDVNVDGSGASLPDSWPSDVPTPEGTVVFSAAAGGTFTATFEIADASVVDRLNAELESAGYAKTQESDFGGLLNAVWENDTYAVTTVYIPGEDGAGDSLQYGIVVKE